MKFDHCGIEVNIQLQTSEIWTNLNKIVISLHPLQSDTLHQLHFVIII